MRRAARRPCRPGPRRRDCRDCRDRRAGFTLIEVLAALVVTGVFVAVAMPYAARLATHWWVGEAAVEAADGWMQAVSRMGDDLDQAVPYGFADGSGAAGGGAGDGAGDGGSGGAAPAMAFRAGPDGIAFVRPALGGAPGLEAVSYEIRTSPAGQALVRRSRRFDPAAFGRDVGGATATLLDGPFRLRIVEVATDGARRRDWAPADGMPAAVELSAAPSGGTTSRAPVPAAPVLMPIPARAPAAAAPGGR